MAGRLAGDFFVPELAAPSSLLFRPAPSDDALDLDGPFSPSPAAGVKKDLMSILSVKAGDLAKKMSFVLKTEYLGVLHCRENMRRERMI